MAALVTLEDLESFSGESDLGFDDVDADTGTLALELASGVVRGHVGWSITREAGAELLAEGSEPWRGVLHVPTLHLVAVTGITIDGEVVDLDAYVPRFRRRGTVWTEPGYPFVTARANEVVVTVTHGHLECPDDVRAVVLAAARRCLSAGQVPAFQTTLGPFSEGLQPAPAGLSAPTLWPGEEAILERYRLPGAP